MKITAEVKDQVYKELDRASEILEDSEFDGLIKDMVEQEVDCGDIDFTYEVAFMTGYISRAVRDLSPVEKVVIHQVLNYLIDTISPL